MIEIKQATITNYETLALLGRVTYSESHGAYIDNIKDLFTYNNKAFSIDKIKENLNDNKNIYHVIYVDGLPVGYTKIVLNENFKTLPNEKNCRLERIYVLSEFIPMKLGKLLLDNAIKTVKKLNYNNLWLSVYIKNYRAIGFYTKNGFTDIGSLNFMVNGKEFPNHVLSKKL